MKISADFEAVKEPAPEGWHNAIIESVEVDTSPSRQVPLAKLRVIPADYAMIIDTYPLTGDLGWEKRLKKAITDIGYPIHSLVQSSLAQLEGAEVTILCKHRLARLNSGPRYYCTIERYVGAGGIKGLVYGAFLEMNREGSSE